MLGKALQFPFTLYRAERWDVNQQEALCVKPERLYVIGEEKRQLRIKFGRPVFPLECNDADKHD